MMLKEERMNVERQRGNDAKVFTNEQIQRMIRAFGAGVGNGVEDEGAFDPEKLRYGKIIIMCDADIDGAHIRTLILTFLWRYMRRAIDNGNVYIAMPPLFSVGRGNHVEWVHSEEDLDATMKRFKKEAPSAKISVQRYKGLGEMNPEQLWETTMDPEVRRMMRVDIKDGEAADKLFSVLMGEDVPERREFIEKYASEVTSLDI